MLSLVTASPPRSRRPRAPLARLALAAACLLAEAALAEPPVPLEAGQTAPATPHYGYTAGETLRYRVTLDERATLSDVTTNRSHGVTVSGSLSLALVVQRVDEAGDMVLIEEIQDARLEVESRGLDVSARDLNRSLTGVGRTLELSPQGSLLDEESVTTTAYDALGLMAFDFSRVGEVVRLEFPSHPLEVGERFPFDESRGGHATGLDARYNLSLVFAGWAQLGSRRCAAFEVSGDVWTELPTGAALADFSGPSLVRGVYRGWVYFDVTAGRVVRVEMDVGSVGQVRLNAVTLDLTDVARWTVELVQ